MSHTYDLVVIGGGSGGVRAARMAAALGRRVALVENQRLGGTCVNVGCIPKKLMSYASHFSHMGHDAAAYGWKADARDHDLSALKAKKDVEISRLNDVYARLLDRNGVETIVGRGHLKDAHTVVVGDRSLDARFILVATGGKPTRPNIPGAHLGMISDDVFLLEQTPARLLVVGGGYIGVEMASIFNGLGAKTTLAYRGALFLRGFDDDVRSFLADEMRKNGVDVRFDTDVVAIDADGDARIVELANGDRLTFDAVLFATGRVPNSDGLGLEDAGVDCAKNGAIVVDPHFQTTAPSVYAIGDVIDGIQLTPVALAQGMAVVKTLFHDIPTAVDVDHVPTAIFSTPEVGTVGLSEKDARTRFSTVHVYRSSFTPLLHTLTGRPQKVLMKLVVDGDSDRVLGVHIVGPEAGEITQGFAVALRAGATKAIFDATIGIHPTAAEELVTMRERLPDPTPPSPH